ATTAATAALAHARARTMTTTPVAASTATSTAKTLAPPASAKELRGPMTMTSPSTTTTSQCRTISSAGKRQSPCLRSLTPLRWAPRPRLAYQQPPTMCGPAAAATTSGAERSVALAARRPTPVMVSSPTSSRGGRAPRASCLTKGRAKSSSPLPNRRTSWTSRSPSGTTTSASVPWRRGRHQLN
ncbi:unnamed protein product, partial [Ectocarpus sp. 4 AP-2014]